MKRYRPPVRTRDLSGVEQTPKPPSYPITPFKLESQRLCKKRATTDRIKVI